MLFLIGIKDDILVLSPSKKLVVQILAAIEIVLGGQVYITNLSGLFGLYELPWIAGASLSVLVIVALINSYNLIDGIDGLAGGIGVVVAISFGIWFWGAGFQPLGILAFVLSGALTGFLYFNMHPAKIFMGDTGAMAVGFILAYLAIQFIQLNQTITESVWYVSHAPVVALAIMIIPVIDTLRVASIRILSGKSPLKADHNHTHHKLIEAKIPQDYASGSLWLANIFIILLAYLLQDMEPNLLTCIILLAALSILPLIKIVFRNIFGITNRPRGKNTAFPIYEKPIRPNKNRTLASVKKLAEFIKE